MPNDKTESLEKGMQKVAEEWHRRLADPAMRLLVDRGVVKVSPLVRRLLKMYPDAGTKPNV